MSEKIKPQFPKVLPEDFTPHWVENMAIEEYHSLKDSISSSGLSEARRSPKHFYHRVCLGEGRKPTDAMVLGSLIHAAVLEPERYSRDMIMQPSFDLRTKIGKQDLEDWQKALKPEWIVVTEKNREIIMRILDSVFSHKQLLGILQAAKTEISGFARDPLAGFGCRIRPDIIIPDDLSILDVKSTEDASEESFIYSIRDYDYDMQAAFYLLMASIIEKKRFETFWWIAVEKTAPYCVELYQADMAWIGIGELKVQRAILAIKYAIENNAWPSYSGTGKIISPPSWLIQREEFSEESLYGQLTASGF